jgi:hypothetical protein
VAYDLSSHSPGVIARHADRCPARTGGRCTCGPLGFRAERDGRPLGPLMETESQARAYARGNGADDYADDQPATFGAALDAFIAQTGGSPELERSLALVDELEDRALESLRRRHLQAELDRLDRAGLSPQRIEAVADAMRTFFGWAVDERLIGHSPAEALIVGRMDPVPAAPGLTTAPDGMIPDHVIWLSLKVATVAFVLIALILVAESV